MDEEEEKNLMRVFLGRRDLRASMDLKSKQNKKVVGLRLFRSSFHTVEEIEH